MSGDILDAIDGALEDWGTSPDAMRWQPPEAQGGTVGTVVMVGPASSGPPNLYELMDEDWRPVEGVVHVELTADASTYLEQINLARARVRAAQVRAEIARREALEEMAARWSATAQQWGVTADQAAASFREFWDGLPTVDDLVPHPRRSTGSTVPARPLPSSRWHRYPQDGELVSRWVSGVCRGWLCGSCTDPSCVHTCHGGHLR